MSVTIFDIMGYLTKIYFALKQQHVDNLQQHQPQQLKLDVPSLEMVDLILIREVYKIITYVPLLQSILSFICACIIRLKEQTGSAPQLEILIH